MSFSSIEHEKKCSKVLYESKVCIPAISSSIKSFTLRKNNDPYHPIDIAQQMLQGVKEFCCENITAIKIPKQIDDWFDEFVENAYDAFAKNKLGESDKLILKTSVKKKNQQYIISIKDNAGGFINKKAGELFTIDGVKPEGKQKDIYIGGEGIGLRNASKFLKKENIDLFFKNRKKVKGAAVKLVFNIS